MRCHRCLSPHPATHRYCSQCGRPLSSAVPAGDNGTRNLVTPPSCSRCGQPVAAAQGALPGVATIEGQRRVVTVLFTDLTGYTSLSERLDPEEIKDLMSRIFGDIAEIVAAYEGFIDKFIGDAAMVLFGVPISHEDDAVRAVRSAMEIHHRVDALGRRLAERVVVPLQMHTGINTGLIVADQNAPMGGACCFTGDAINVAARLESMARPGEILVGPGTVAQSEGFFEFTETPLSRVRGKSDSLPIYKLVAAKKAPAHFRRPGHKARLAGRLKELNDLQQLFRQVLMQGRHARVSISGEAGIGKSRLADEFKSRILADHVRWLDGRAFALTARQPYAMFIDLLIRALAIGDTESPDQIQARLGPILQGGEHRAAEVISDVMALLLAGPSESVRQTPEARKENLYQSAGMLMNAVLGGAPTIICLDDLQWADPSSIDLTAFLFDHLQTPLLLLGLSRPAATGEVDPFTNALGSADLALHLADLSASDSFAMVTSILNSTSIPSDLRRLISEKAEGNPFYIEEVLHALIETGMLVRNNDGWRLTRGLNRLQLPASVTGTIAGRLDRLHRDMKQVLKEAAVIGRNFQYRILSRISAFGSNLQPHLQSLIERNLITAGTTAPPGEYRFKHALTQEVVYHGMLRKERRDIHERIGRICETLSGPNQAPVYEMLAYHYSKGHSLDKSILYMVKAGQKCLGQYCLPEAQRHFNDAYGLLCRLNRGTVEQRRLLIDLINQWAFVFYYRGRYHDLLELLERHRDLASQVADEKRSGMYRAWLGCALWHREEFQKAHGCMEKAVEAGEKTRDVRLIGYACAWMSWIETELGRFDRAIANARRAQDIYRCAGAGDAYIYINSLAGMGYAHWHRGDRRRTRAAGRVLLAYAKRHSEKRSRVMGLCCLGWSHLIDGKPRAAGKCFHKAVEVSTDPWYAVFPKLALSYGWILNGREGQAAELIDEILSFHQAHGAEFAGGPAGFFKGLIEVSQGQPARGLARMQERLQHWQDNGCRLRYTSCALIMAVVYARLACSRPSVHARVCLRFPFFFYRTMRVAEKRAMATFEAVVRHAAAINADHVMGQAHLHWGLLWRAKGCSRQSRRCLTEAAHAFERCGAEGYLKQVRGLLDAPEVGGE